MKKVAFRTNDGTEINYVDSISFGKTLILLVCDKNSKMDRAVNGDTTTLRFSKENGKFVEFTITEVGK